MNKERFKGILIGMALVLVFSFTTNTSLAETVQKNIRVLYSDIRIVIDGVKVTPKDSKGQVVEPFIYEGTTYLPVRAIGEALGQQVNWDQNSKTVYIGKMPKVTYNSCGPEEFFNRHKPFNPNWSTYSSFSVKDAGTVQLRQEDYNYFNRVSNGQGTYLINGNYTKIKGTLLAADNESTTYQGQITISGDDRLLFDSNKYLRELGYEYGKIQIGSKDQPVHYEVDITGVEELKLIISNNIYNLEFIGLGN